MISYCNNCGHKREQFQKEGLKCKTCGVIFQKLRMDDLSVRFAKLLREVYFLKTAFDEYTKLPRDESIFGTVMRVENILEHLDGVIQPLISNNNRVARGLPYLQLSIINRMQERLQ